jgi:proteasome assembly chaperone (PAC2) family protein
MEMGKVIFSNGVLQNLEDLIFILFYKDYFTFQINAFLYTDSIIDFVEKSIYTFPHKKHQKNYRI